MAALLTVPPATQGGSAAPATELDQPLAEVWPAVNAWTPRLEDEYAAFVATLGGAVAARRCGKLASCLRDPAANILYEAKQDARLEGVADCADLPYLLRAYFAFKRRLPFGFVSDVEGKPGRSIRYTSNVRPIAFRSWRDFRTPRALLEQMVNLVHSGMYRTAPEVEDSDFYPISIDRRVLRPGTIFYDPNGHVAVVAEVRADGGVYLLGGHPDGSLTWSRFGESFALGGAGQGGGFKAFRPLALRAGRLERAANRTLPWFDALAQFDRARYRVGGAPAGYHAWVRATLAEPGQAPDPVAELREQVRALCRDVSDRIDAVDVAVAAGLPGRPHPPALPDNVYGTSGEWEIYSTPSRDARLKAAVRELRTSLAALPELGLRAPALAAAWREEAGRPECQFAYRRSGGQTQAFTLDTVMDRLFALSFDPYHCVERRWGAPEGSGELLTCGDGADKRTWYTDEARLRNRIDREYGAPTALLSGPAEAPDVDPRKLWR